MRKQKEIPTFTLWLEFEEVEPGNWDIHNEFANIRVSLPDGRFYGVNVWTYGYFGTALRDDIENNKNLNGLYLKPPDLFVKELTRECIEAAIADLLADGNLEDMLNPTIGPHYKKDEP